MKKMFLVLLCLASLLLSGCSMLGSIIPIAQKKEAPQDVHAVAYSEDAIVMEHAVSEL